MTGTRSPTLPTIPESGETQHQPDSPGRVSAVRRNPILSTPAGASLHGCIVTEADHALERQILDCSHQAMRCEKLGRLPEAISWSRAMQEAIAARRPEVVEAWEAVERQWLDEGLCYFSSGAAHGGVS